MFISMSKIVYVKLVGIQNIYKETLNVQAAALSLCGAVKEAEEQRQHAEKLMEEIEKLQDDAERLANNAETFEVRI